MQHIEDGLKALDQANEELALIEASAEWQAYTTALAEAKIEQSVAESATPLDIPLTATETVTAVVKGAK